MNSTNPEIQNSQEPPEKANKSANGSEKQVPKTSATTKDIPSFGCSAYAKRVNGRFAMIGFSAILLIEALSNDSFLHWAGLLP